MVVVLKSMMLVHELLETACVEPCILKCVHKLADREQEAH